MSEWISVEDENPEEYLPIIGLDSAQYNLMILCTFADGKFLQDTTVADCYGGEPLAELSDFNVTHWQPLPEPPQ